MATVAVATLEAVAVGVTTAVTVLVVPQAEKSVRSRKRGPMRTEQ
jgi:hypothetical protein